MDVQANRRTTCNSFSYMHYVLKQTLHLENYSFRSLEERSVYELDSSSR